MVKLAKVQRKDVVASLGPQTKVEPTTGDYQGKLGKRVESQISAGQARVLK